VFAAKDCLEDLFDADDQLSGLARLRSEVAGISPEEIKSPLKNPPTSARMD
jgi:hypothetical protein